MPKLTHIGRVIVPVADQDDAIKFYTETLGCTLTADVPFGDGARWVEVMPQGGGVIRDGSVEVPREPVDVTPVRPRRG